MYRLVLLVAALILYGSLYPWQFHPRDPSQGVLEVLVAHWPRTLDPFVLRDLIINILLYIPLGAAAYMASARQAGKLRRTLLAAVAGLVLSTTVELLQLFVAGRVPSLFDIVCNLAGSLVGAFAATAYADAIERILRRRTEAWKTAPGSVALLALFAVFQLYPLFPALSRTALHAKVAAFLQSHASPVELTRATAEWLAAGIFLEVLFVRPAPRFVCLALLLPARLLLAGPGVAVADVAGFAIGFILWVLLPDEAAVRYPLAATIFIAELLVYGIDPFHLQVTRSPHSFSWIPFFAMLHMDWQTGGYILVRKSFDYGAALSLLHLANVGYLRAAAAVASILAVMEFLQRWLPGRTPEITDPVLALVLVFALWRLDHEYRKPLHPRIPVRWRA
jgi:VanZ family protein